MDIGWREKKKPGIRDMIYCIFYPFSKNIHAHLHFHFDNNEKNPVNLICDRKFIDVLLLFFVLIFMILFAWFSSISRRRCFNIHNIRMRLKKRSFYLHVVYIFIYFCFRMMFVMCFSKCLNGSLYFLIPS